MCHIDGGGRINRPTIGENTVTIFHLIHIVASSAGLLASTVCLETRRVGGLTCWTFGPRLGGSIYLRREG